MNSEMKVDGCGTKTWYLNGRVHRTDGPAVEYADGSTQWWVNGQRHREDGPAMELSNGTKFWFLNGNLHREDGPAVEYADGTKEWYLNEQRHRSDGPAIEYADGSKFWFLNDQLHRTDGPAVEWPLGTKQWWVNGQQVQESEVNRQTKDVIVATGTMAAKERLKMLAGLPHLPTDFTLQARHAIAGEGPLAGEWEDKPHRLVYDLCAIIEAAAAEQG